MSKAPVPGLVKTRLVPLLGQEGAARLYRTLLENTLTKLTAADLCPLGLCCAPDTRQDFFTACRRRYRLDLTEQGPGDLGQRMSRAVATALQQADRVVLVGADCPSLTGDDVDMALQQLGHGTDVVLGPAEDGGYYLIGMTRHHARLFEAVPWGSAQVMDRTRQHIEALGLACRMLPTRADLDTPADYQAWAGPARCDARTDKAC
ncbi:MAG: TIGR04282 family arsenosugar biosynthesis glycosyltransferase [Gammaproteobacteria bacterium]